MLRKIFFVITFFFFSWTIYGQDETGRYFNLGVEVQQYPTGFLLGISSEIGLSPHHAMDFRVGYNTLDHKDFGVNESEIGGGFGFTVGYCYYFNSDNQKWFLGARSDLWFNEIDWLENREDEMASGTTKVTVFQPTAMVGYRFLINEKWVIAPTLAFGVEINIKTKGQEVGQGAIILWGVNAAYKF